MTKKLKGNLKAVIAIIIAVALILSGLYVYITFFPRKEKPEEIVITPKIYTTELLTKTYDQLKAEGLLNLLNITDNRISPLENQGLVLEVKRIRHRGLLDLMFKPGTAWKKKPMFYFISEMDGLKYVSKDIESAGGAKAETLFNTWDAIFQESKIMKDVPEEQETSDVTLTIMEREKTGLLGFKTEDVEREKIHLVYDYRTGRWTGDDYFDDCDGYGHYVGDNFEIWFDLYQIDYDMDGIPYWVEVNILHTNPKVDDSKLDPDNDGVPTAWEWRWGYDPLVWDDHKNLDPDIDGIENIEEYKMAKWFADPFRPDIYIEVDGMQKGGLFDIQHVFWKESQQMLIERFCQHGINVYIDDGWPGDPTNGGGELLPYYDTLSQDSGMMLQFYNNHFPDERKGIFRYLVVAHNSGFCHPSKFNRYDTLTIDSSPYKLYLRRAAFTPRTQRIVLASAAMHELGHSMGIAPWTIEGCDNISFARGENAKERREAKERYLETWGNYRSVMNYYYIFDKKLVDYSDGSSGSPYDQNDWLELYLPTFQIEANVIEEPFFEPPGKDKIVNETVSFSVNGWVYDENLTQQYLKKISGWSPIEPVKCKFRVYRRVENGTTPGDRDIRIYAQPIYKTTIVPPSEWTLIKEGYVDNQGSFHL
ncbi:MAG: hypothetical protein J7K62_03885 [Thermoplasmata archaeon]|nr:hypothetical protein [Thermoplasmata archaeon]